MSTDPHARALELRRMLIDLHACRDGGRAVGIWDIREAETELFDHLRAHRAELGRTDFWSGYYAEMDEHDRTDTAGPEFVTLCGSMRYFAQMLTVAAELSSDGVIVLAPFRVIPPGLQDGPDKAALDALHRDKIRAASWRVVVVSDESGYYGESTAAEIAFAQTIGRTVQYRRVGNQQEVTR